MNAKRKLKFSAQVVPCARKTIDLVTRLACTSCEITVLDMKRNDIAQRETARYPFCSSRGD